jgi:hypothetical protein
MDDALKKPLVPDTSDLLTWDQSVIETEKLYAGLLGTPI